MTSPGDNGAELNTDMPEVGNEEISFAELTGDEPSAYAEAADHSVAVEDFGTTADEMSEGESLDGRLARELPDVTADTPEGYDENLPEGDPGEGDAGEGDLTGNGLAANAGSNDPDDYLVGRLVEADEGAREDTTAETVASDLGSDGGGFSAEESAMHIDPDS